MLKIQFRFAGLRQKDLELHRDNRGFHPNIYVIREENVLKCLLSHEVRETISAKIQGNISEAILIRFSRKLLQVILGGILETMSEQKQPTLDFFFQEFENRLRWEFAKESLEKKLK